MSASASIANPAEAPDWPTRFCMLIGGLMISLALAALSPVLPQIEAALAHDDAERLMVKMLVSGIGATMVIGAPLAGLLVDRLGPRRLLVIYSLVFAAAGTAGLYLTSLPVLLASRVLVGLAASGMATISMTLINTRLPSEERARFMGFHIATAMLGGLVIYPAIGALGELGWRWPFAAYALSLTVTAAAIAGLREPARNRAGNTPGTVGQKAAEDRNPLRWFPLWFLPLALAMGSVTYLPAVYMPFVMRDAGVATPSLIAAVMLADAVLGAVMSLLFGWSQRRISSNTAFLFSFTCTASGMLIVAAGGSLAMIVLGMLVFGLGIGWFVPNLMISLSRRVTQAQQGRAVGIIKAAHYLGSPAGVLLVEPVARAHGPAGGMLVGAVISFLAVSALVVARMRERPAPPFSSAGPTADVAGG